MASWFCVGPVNEGSGVGHLTPMCSVLKQDTSRIVLVQGYYWLNMKVVPT